MRHVSSHVRLSRRWVIMPLLGAMFVTTVAFAQGPGAPAGFGIDGNLLSNSPSTAPFNTANDWVPGSNPPGTAVMDNAGNPIDPSTTFHIFDLTQHEDLSVFHGGTKKNGDPNNWTWTMGEPKPPKKDDISHALFHTRVAPNGDVWIFMAGDRLSTTGSSYIDFELLQSPLTKNANGTFTSFGPDSGRTVGDLLVTLELSHGGRQATFYVERWEPDPKNDYAYHDIIPAPNVAFAAANIDSAVWVPYSAFGSTSYEVNAFAEAALNVTQLLVNLQPCLDVPILFVRTKASALSDQAVLKDFVDLVALNLTTRPDVNAGPDKHLTCLVDLVELQGSSTTPNVTFEWDVYDGGHIVSGANTWTPEVDAPGTYVLTVSSAAGCESADTVVVTADTTPPDVDAGPDKFLTCSVTETTLSGSSATPGVTFSWIATAGGHIVSGATTPNPLVDASGTYILTVTNPTNGCTASDTALVVITPDNEPPKIVCPPNVTLECHDSTDPENTGYATATDNCDEDPDIDHSDYVIDGSCPNEFTIERTWTATDDAGNSTFCMQLISVMDTIPPVLSGCPGGIRILCDAPVPPPPSVTATDNCEGVTVDFKETKQLNGCGGYTGTIVRTWVATDACGNKDTCQQIITVYDETAPVCDRVPPDTSFFLCDPGSEVCVPVGGSDACDATVSCWVVSGPGEVVGGRWCYTASKTEAFDVRVACADDCDNRCEIPFHVVIDINEAPVCHVPHDTLIGLCEAAEVRLPVFGTDSDGNLLRCEIAGGVGRLESGYWVYMPSGDETQCVTIRCVDECGAECQARFCVEFDVGQPPICVLPNDTTIVLCDPVLVCLPITVEVTKSDGPAAQCFISSGPGTITNGAWCYTPADRDTTFTVGIECVDTCGAGCRGSFAVTFEMNQPPSCQFLTPSSPICTPSIAFVPFTSIDPDGDAVTCRLDGPGELTDAGWQYIPTPGEQISVRVVCTDPCGDSCEIGWDMSFPARVPPICNLPNDTTITLCLGTEVALPVWATGAVCQITSGPGSLFQGNWTYTPTVPGTVNVSVLCVSETGCDSCSGSFAVTFELLSSPTIAFDGGGTASFFLCQPASVCLPYTAADGLGGDQFSVSVVSGPGTVDAANSRICFTPTESGVSVIIARVEDACGSAQDTITVTVDINEPPVCRLPSGDTTIVLCEPRQICLPVSATDADDNLVSCVLTEGPGQITSGQWCYTPGGTSDVTVTITCTDECGATCVNTFTITLDLEGSPPVCHVPNDTLVVICPPEPISLPVWADDPDGDLIACMVIDGPGELIDGNWTYLPISEGEAIVTVRCTDACGHFCEESFMIILDLNDPPVIDIPEQVTKNICGPQEICIPIATEDRNKNLEICEVILGPGYMSGDYWCYAASGGDEVVNVTIRCTDACGVIDQRQMRVFIDGSDLPSCNLPASGRIVLCEPGELCLPIHFADPYTSGVTCVLLDGDGEIRGNEWCLEVETATEVTIAVRCTNECQDECTATRTYTIEIDPKDCDGGVYAGDIDNSGTLDVMDLTRLARLLYTHDGGAATPTVAGATRRTMPVEADVNCDGMVNEDDMRYLAAYLFNSGPLPCRISGARAPVGNGDDDGSSTENRSGKRNSSGGR
ncbi:MAG TPA: hypothetical protein VM118_12525 [Acidobacteriota bacterium]|nr:hypothetical protein [Acidobacteriota bacterium]